MNPPLRDAWLSGDDGGVSSSLLDPKLSVSPPSLEVLGLDKEALKGVSSTCEGCVEGAADGV